MENVTVLDADDFGTLYSVEMPHLDLTISMYVNDDDEEYTTTDWQGRQPQTIDEMAQYDWVNAELWQVLES